MSVAEAEHLTTDDDAGSQPLEAMRLACRTLASTYPRLLEGVGAPGQQVGTIGRSSGIERPLPGGTALIVLRRDVRDAVWRMAEQAHDWLGLSGDVWSNAVMHNARTLERHAERLLERPEGPQMARELEALAHRCVVLLEPPGARQYVGPCPDCGGDLRALEGEPARCSACRRKVDAPTQQRLALETARGRLLSAADLCRLAPLAWRGRRLNKMRVSRWRAAGVLSPAGTAADGAALYRVADVDLLMTGSD